MAKEPEATQKAEEAQQQQQQQPQLRVDDSNVEASYANFCRVMGSPEELVIDFGLNPQSTQIPTEPIKVSQRTVVNFFTAKRLLAALNVSVQRHEAMFGVLETDVQKRFRGQVAANSGNAPAEG